MNKNATVLDDLYDTGFKIYQNNEYFKFSLDSLLLAKFVKTDYKDKNCIYGTGWKTKTGRKPQFQAE